MQAETRNGTDRGAEAQDPLADVWRRLLADDAPVRPAEQARLGRVFLAAADTGLPTDAMRRIWRSLCGEAMARQGLAAVFLAGTDAVMTRDGARSYFGFAPGVIHVAEVREALERIEETPDTFACVPWPEIAGAGQWWPMLNETRFRNLAILAGWPAPESGGPSAPRVAIVGKAPLELSGDDDALVTVHDDTRSAEPTLTRFGVRPNVVARARSLTLIRLHGFAAGDEARLDAARMAGLDGLRLIGVLPRA